MVARFLGLSYAYPDASAPALRDVSCEIDGGLTLVVGSSAGGKSSLLRCLNGLVPHFHGGTIAGDVEILGTSSARSSISHLARQAAFVFQDPERQLVATTVEREVAFGPRNLGLARQEIEERVATALATCRIEHLRGREVRRLSGGEKQRVALAGATAMRPAAIVLDEPTSQLDAESSDGIIAALLALRDGGTAVVIAEHRLDRLLPAGDSLLAVEAGRVGGPGSPRQMAMRLASPPQVVELGRRLEWEPLPLSLAEARGRMPALQSAPPPRPATTAVAWEIQGLACGPSRTPVLESVDVVGHVGEVIVLMGPNGGGKTTLLRTLAGLLSPRSGRLSRGQDRAAYLPQEPAAILHRSTVRAEIELSLRWAGVRANPDELLSSFGCADLGGRDPRDLSGGERQRAAIAAILCSTPSLALLDEPTRGMDANARQLLVSTIDGLAGGGASVVVATHDTELAASIAHRVLWVADHAVRDLGHPNRALSGESPVATQIGRLCPGGPVTVDGAVTALRAADRRIQAAL